MHSAIIVLSTSKPGPEDMHGLEDEVFEAGEIPSVIDYIGDDYTGEEAEAFLSRPCPWYSVSEDGETLTPMDEERFKPLYAGNVREAADSYAADSRGNAADVMDIAKYGSDDMAYRWFHVDGEFLTLPGLVRYYGGRALYVKALTDYHV